MEHPYSFSAGEVKAAGSSAGRQTDWLQSGNQRVVIRLRGI